MTKEINLKNQAVVYKLCQNIMSNYTNCYKKKRMNILNSTFMKKMELKVLTQLVDQQAFSLTIVLLA